MPKKRKGAWTSQHQGRIVRFPNKGGIGDKRFRVVNSGGTLVRTEPKARGLRWLRKRGFASGPAQKHERRRHFTEIEDPQ